MPPEIRRSLRAQPLLPARPLPQTRWQRFYKRYFSSWIAKIAAVAVGASPFLITIWTAYQNTLPEVGARDTDDNRSFALPFIVENKSSIFDMKDVKISCGFGSFFLEDEYGHTIGMFAKLNTSLPDRKIAPGERANITCDGSRMVSYQVPMSSRGPKINMPPRPGKLTVRYLQTTIDVQYTTLFWHRSFKSDMFTWDRDSQGMHWTKGNVIR